ncbi:MAG: ATP-binding protein [Thermodesulfovibrionales bacterium]|nr:ATP-binding protein [Thermodesulfovibrionales bacterium]
MAQKTDELDIIVSESERIETLTGDLLLYSRPVEIKSQEFNIRELIEETIKSMNLSAKADVKISATEGMKIKSDRDKLKQLLLNIIQNSYESLKDRGEIDIKAAVVVNALSISIKDNGCGMDRETMEKVFKPFFTTKVRGTGLGLPIVEKLIKSMGGKIEIESEPGMGTIFRITIPCSGD